MAIGSATADAIVIGSGFGGSISAFRLAELYRAAGANPSILVLERGRRRRHVDFKQSMHVDHLSEVYQLIQGQGAQVVVANGVGGGSQLYLAASIRSPRETFERRDRRPGDGPERRMWPGRPVKVRNASGGCAAASRAARSPDPSATIRVSGSSPPRPIRRGAELANTQVWPSLVGTTPDAAYGR